MHSWCDAEDSQGVGWGNWRAIFHSLKPEVLTAMRGHENRHSRMN